MLIIRHLSLYFLVFCTQQIVQTCNAAEVFTFDVASSGPGTISGNTLTLTTGTLTADSVDFVAQLTVVGNSNLGQSGSQLGVNNSVINVGESLDFSMAILSQSGGTVNFDGFTILDFNAYTTTGGDLASLNGQTLPQSTLDDFDLTAAPFNTPNTINLVGLDPGTGTTSFGIAELIGQFSGTSATAVPEPSALVLLGAIGFITAYRQRRNS